MLSQLISGKMIHLFVLRMSFVAYSMLLVLMSTLVFTHMLQGEEVKSVIQLMVGIQGVFVMFEGAIAIARLIKHAVRGDQDKYKQSPLSSQTATTLFHLVTLNSSLTLLRSAEDAKFPWSKLVDSTTTTEATS